MTECVHKIDDAIKWLEYEGKEYLVCHQCGQQFIEKPITSLAGGKSE